MVRALLADTEGITVSVSHTTRPPRPGEQHGRDYYFVDELQFQRMVDDGAFLEHALVFGNRYGTSRDAVADHLAVGEDVILEIDWQGARTVRQAFPEAVSIYILPPSREALQERLSSRGQDQPSVIAARMDKAVEEMGHWAEFDFVVVNNEFDLALVQLRTVVEASRLRVDRRGEPFAVWVQSLLA